MADINATSLADVPLADIVVFLATYVGFFYYFGLVIGAIAIVWGYAQIKK